MGIHREGSSCLPCLMKPGGLDFKWFCPINAPGQLQNSDSAEERDIYSAVMTNARNKVVFGGIDPAELEPIARLLTINTFDPKKVKPIFYS